MGTMKMLVNVHEDETRIALTDNSILTDLHNQQTSRERTAGNIYRGVVVKVNPAFQAAFVDYGERKNGFLALNDLNPALFKGSGGKGRPRIQSLLKSGQTVLVQVLKESIGNKGAALTTFISLPGRYLVLTPNSERHGISRKIEDADKRSQLREVLAAIAGEEMGVIVRTAGIDRSMTELKRDLTELNKSWKEIKTQHDSMGKPGLIHQDASSIVRVLRDYFSDKVEEVWVDSAEAFQESLNYFKSQMPKFQKRLKLYVGDKSLFSAYGVEQQIETLNSNKVSLPSGGGIVLESTEALVSVDVNSGKSNQASDIEETALNTNMEAAQEVGRQLRLRNLGGLVVVDFIDMGHKRNRDKVERAMTDALKHDKARTTVGSISQFGLLELSRQRIDMEHTRGLRIACENCGGTGYVPTLSSRANQVLRKIRELAASGSSDEIHGTLSMAQANFILNEKRESLRDLELEFDVRILLNGKYDQSEGEPVSLTGKLQTDQESSAAPETSAKPVSAGGEASQDHESSRRRRGKQSAEKEDREAPEVQAEKAESSAGAGESGATEPASQRSDNRGDGSGADSGKAAQPRKGGNGDGRATGKGSAPEASNAPGNGAGSMEPAFKPFTLRGRRRRVFLPEADFVPKSGNAFFESSHLPGNSENQATLPKPSKRPNPIAEMAKDREAGDVVFLSSHTEKSVQAETGSTEGPAPAAKSRPRRRRGGGARARQAAANSSNTSASGDGAKSKSSGPRRKGRAGGGAKTEAAEQAGG